MLIWSIAKSRARVALASYARCQSFASLTTVEIAEALGIGVEAALAARDRSISASSDPLPEVTDGVAVIPIEGLLLNEHDPWLELFGVAHTSYRAITAMVLAAEADDEVESIVFKVNSPGGHAEGLNAAADAILTAKKPTRAVISTMAASAAYWLASQAGTIEAADRTAEIGSIGVAVDVWVSDSVVSIASTAAPEKRPDVTTDDGKDIVRKLLDQHHDMFAEAIMRGRGVSRATVDADFGQGGILLAERALAAGMIDSIGTTSTTPNTGTEAMATKTNDNTSGLRAILGLSEDASHEDLVRTAISIKGKADEHESLSARLAQQVQLVEAGKDLLTKATARVEEMEAESTKRDKADFESRRSGVVNKAVEDGKIVPAQVESFIAIASNEEGLKGVEALFKKTASNGLTTTSAAVSASPNGATGRADLVAHAKSDYGLSDAEAEKYADRKIGKGENQ